MILQAHMQPCVLLLCEKQELRHHIVIRDYLANWITKCSKKYSPTSNINLYSFINDIYLNVLVMLKDNTFQNLINFNSGSLQLLMTDNVLLTMWC